MCGMDRKLKVANLRMHVCMEVALGFSSGRMNLYLHPTLKGGTFDDFTRDHLSECTISLIEYNLSMKCMFHCNDQYASYLFS